MNRPLAPDANSDMLARGNPFMGTNPAMPAANGNDFDPSYDCTPDASVSLVAEIPANVGTK